MKKIISFILLSLFIISSAANVFVYGVEDGGRTIIYEPEFSEDGKLIFYPQSDGTYAVTYRNRDLIKGTLEIPAEFNGKKVTVIIENSFFNCDITELILHENLEVIEKSAFLYTNIKSVSIPDSVTTIGQGAFYDFVLESIHIGAGCKDINSAFGGPIKKITVSDNNELYYGEGNCLIEKATKTLILGCSGSSIPNGVVYIGEGAFAYKDELMNITIPESVAEIGDSAFAHCTGLKSIVIPENVKKIGYNAFTHSGLELLNIESKDCDFGIGSNFQGLPLQRVILCDGIKVIKKFMFQNCTSLTAIEIPDSVETIEEGAFRGCTALSSLKLNEGLAEIGEKAFYDCKSIQELTIPDSVKKIDRSAFSVGGVSPISPRLKSVTIGKELEYLGDGAFGGCNQLETCTVNSDVLTYIGDGAFTNCESLKEFKIPECVTIINDHVFAGCKSLQSIIIPDSITEICDKAFYLCSNLTNVKFGSGLKKIGNAAFSECKLDTVILPEGFYYIGQEAFKSCPVIKELYIPDSIEYVDIKAFSTTVMTKHNGAYYVGNFKNPYLVFVGLRDGNADDVKIEKGTKVIARSAFQLNFKVKTVSMPDTVQIINDHAFAACRYLTDIYYEGSADQWRNMTVCNNYGNDESREVLGSVNVVYNSDLGYGTPFADVNGDWDVNNKDVVVLFKYVSGVGTVYCDENACDVNLDGSVDNKDVVTIFNIVSCSE